MVRWRWSTTFISLCRCSHQFAKSKCREDFVSTSASEWKWRPTALWKLSNVARNWQTQIFSFTEIWFGQHMNSKRNRCIGNAGHHYKQKYGLHLFMYAMKSWSSFLVTCKDNKQTAQIHERQKSQKAGVHDVKINLDQKYSGTAAIPWRPWWIFCASADAHTYAD